MKVNSDLKIHFSQNVGKFNRLNLNSNHEDVLLMLEQSSSIQIRLKRHTFKKVIDEFINELIKDLQIKNNCIYNSGSTNIVWGKCEGGEELSIVEIDYFLSCKKYEE